MKDITINTTIKHCQLNELTIQEQSLIRHAIEATANAYAPYSHFHVGVAILLADNTIIIGANQENSSFPAGICAERAALFNTQSNKPEQPVLAIAIAARSQSGLVPEPVTPCGVCRQAMLEIEQRYKRNVRLYLYGTHGVYVVNSIKDLLPLAFSDFK